MGRHVSCSYCGKPAELVGGAVIYPHRDDLGDRWFWRCVPCVAWVGCHRAQKPGDPYDVPLGRLANAELRRAKIAAHAAFDPLWKKPGGLMSRKEAYAWLSSCLSMKGTVHIWDLDLEGCRSVVLCVRLRQRAA